MPDLMLQFAESKALAWADQFCYEHERCFGNESISINSLSEYQMLRQVLAYTAGYRRSQPYGMDMEVELQTSKSRNVYQQITRKGWSVVSNNLLARCSDTDIAEINNLLQQPRQAGKRSIQVPLTAGTLLRNAIDQDIFSVIKAYLRTARPVFYKPHILMSSPPTVGNTMSAKELSDSAFSFHRDYDNIRWLKLFVNLSTTSGGQHEFVMGSHHTNERHVNSDYVERSKDLNFEDQFMAQTLYESHIWTGRFHEKGVENIYGPSRIVRFPTTAGFCWLEDTYGLHRGNPPETGKRNVAAFLIGQYPVRQSQ